MLPTITTATVRRRLLQCYRKLPASPSTEQQLAIRKDVQRILDELGPLHDSGIAESIIGYLKLIGLRIGEPNLGEMMHLIAQNAKSSATAVARAPVAGRTPPARQQPARKLPRIAAKGKPGISLVTCCMNRNENLCKALHSWLPHSQIDEIIIVDWSSKVPVKEELAQRGIEDSRIRIVRVSGEPRWILSYAFNAGFRAAKHDQILKVDADIVLSQDFFSANFLAQGRFIAGNWRTVAKNQAYVNGFFFAPRAAIYAVGGFNEQITTYGWDDDDIYNRMTIAGFVRSDVAPDTVRHLDHPDEERLGETAHQPQSKSAIDTIMSDTLYKTRRNRYLSNVMPYWSEKSEPVGFEIMTADQTGLNLQRDQWVPSEVPSHISSQADYIALWEIAGWRCGPRMRWLEEPALRRLLAKPLGAITKLDIELSITNPDRTVDPALRYLVVRIRKLRDLLKDHTQTDELVDWLRNLSDQWRHTGRVLVIQAPMTSWPENAPKDLADYLLVPTWSDIGEPKVLPWAQVNAVAEVPDMELLTQVDLSDLKIDTPSKVIVQVPRAKIFIDVQHGLGNRLRAMASAAAIARATDRELVVVWQPDPHCEGRIYDLFEYKGAVEEEGFIANAHHKGYKAYNYMEAEEGSQKDEPIDLTHSGHIYARTAYTLKAAPSTWERENEFLRQLKPVQRVQEMVASVPTPNDVSAHVRMAGGTKYEHLPYESMDNWTAEGHAQIAYWREKSHFSHFMQRIDKLVAEGTAHRIFLAADAPETYGAFFQTYGDRLVYLDRSLYDRSAEQLRFALADAMLLGMSTLLLGSTWSSFSELALRLSSKPPKTEMSGKHF